MPNASNAHQRQGLVEFQRQIFAQIDAFQQRGDERLCLRADAGSIAWAMDANDIVHVTQLPRNIPLIPAAPSYVRGLLQSDGEVYTVFDLGHILSDTPTPVHKSNRVLMLHPSLMANTALLVDKTYSLSAIESFHVDPDTSPAPLGTTVLRDNETDSAWNWLDFQALLTSSAFATRRLDIHAA